MSKNYIIGFPRIGENRELKFALEGYLKQKISQNELLKVAKELRLKHWQEQKEIDCISSNDFSFYDNMLDVAMAIGAVPKRFAHIDDSLELQLAMARGTGKEKAMEMTKWFNTNYHYIVPELSIDDSYRVDISKIKAEFLEAKESGFETKINLIGPFTFTALSKRVDGTGSFELFDKVVSAYEQMIKEISLLDENIIVQIEEPIFVTDRVEEFASLIAPTYDRLSSYAVAIYLVTYFERADEAIRELVKTQIDAIGVDFVDGVQNNETLKLIAHSGKKLIAGVVNGRNIWRVNYESTLNLLDSISSIVPKEEIIISSSCSLLHLPYSSENEDSLPQGLKERLSFAKEKVQQTLLLSKLFFGESLSKDETKQVQENKLLFESLHSDNTTKSQPLQKLQREGDFAHRIAVQKKRLNLPTLPTTTIGSFPQTKELREYRAGYKKGVISQEAYENYIEKYIDEVIELQERLGLDVLVHGEPERNDMVEFFGQKLKGYGFTQNGWVQSYGTRCVKPPIIYEDVKRGESLSGRWIEYAQSKTQKPLKGMLTGPVTMINWSFVREDIDIDIVAQQIALAINEEVDELQNAGIAIIQVDEAAFKEGYPLRKENVAAYEKWAVESFRLCVSSAKVDTQIHTHMCYSNFDEIIKTIEAMDADVISIETARSGNRLLKIFASVGYKQEIGLGVYDIHSPRVPSIEELKEQIQSLLEVLPKEQLWINPDCGLKTRGFEEVELSLKNMVEATKSFR